MGTVHGVYLKYVGLSALSFAGYTYFAKDDLGAKVSLAELLGHSSRGLAALAGAAAKEAGSDPNGTLSLLKTTVPALIMGYSTFLNGVIAVLFKLEVGMGLIGKNRKLGTIPTWSYVMFFPFHIPTILYTHIHTRTSKYKVEKEGKVSEEVVPVASEVQPGWWVGGCYADELHKDWAGVIDLTVEFPESTIKTTKAYLSLPTWDGVPASPDQIEEAANFGVAARQNGDVLVHCAHGRGRSTTIMCACLVKAGLYRTWLEAFEEGIKPGRSVCKLNKRMRQNLTMWQETFVDGREKKGQ